jgi:hypothetical protein
MTLSVAEQEEVRVLDVNDQCSLIDWGEQLGSGATEEEEKIIIDTFQFKIYWAVQWCFVRVS